MQSKVRILGSGFTVMTWQGQRLAYLRGLGERAPRPVGAGNEAIQPIDEPHPIEIVTALAVGAGEVSLRFYELWNQPVWAQLPGFEGTSNLLEVLQRQVQLGEITIRKVIKNPSGTYRTRVYHNCVIIDFDDSEQVDINTLTLPKEIRVAFTHTTAV